MAKDDWSELVGILDSSAARRTASRGFAPPPGGGLTTYVINTLTNNPGVYAVHYNGAGFSPSDPNKGFSMSMPIKRGVSGGATGFANFIFIMLQGTNVADEAYLLGLGDAEPAHLVLRKGPLTGGLPDIPPGTQGVLARSTATYPRDTWVHVFLEAVVNESGGVPNDTVINVKVNDLNAHPLGSPPSWVVPAGMPAVIDDAAGVNTGSPGFTAGRAGWGGYSAAAASRMLFDHAQIILQP